MKTSDFAARTASRNFYTVKADPQKLYPTTRAANYDCVAIEAGNSRDRKQDAALARFDSVQKEIAEIRTTFAAQDQTRADSAPQSGTVALTDFATDKGSLSGEISPQRAQAERADGADTFQFWTRPTENGSLLHVNQDHRGPEGSSFISENYHLDPTGNLVFFERQEA